MRSFSTFAIVVGLIAAGSAGCSKSPDLAAVRSVCLVVEQKHPKVGGDFRLPIEERLRAVLNRMGLEVQEAGRPCDARLDVSLTFDVFGKVHFYSPPRTLYSASKATGEARLEVKGFRTVRKRLSGRQATSVVDDSYGMTNEVVYRETFQEVVTEILVGFWGGRAVIALLEGEFMSEGSFLSMIQDRLLSENVVVPALVSAIVGDDVEVRKPAIDVLRYTIARDERVAALMRRAKGAVDMLILRTQAENAPEIRDDAAGVLGDLSLEPDRVVPVLISLLSEDSEDLRVSAMVSLGQYGPKAAKAIPLLEAMLAAPSQRIRMIAKESLDKIRS